ncbi:hypothetical protein [Denitromonas halophila]|uniref:Uncharacterized protein n=1 Tax=Denitromonas halophila TaxID=1629404 RepID=A0A557R2R9_9RHOO|nr:hypothetical protein [Denitromonas halophila]TVO59455.1 hypothetical protein FHP91_01715 [Denitromonas halophila]
MQMVLIDPELWKRTRAGARAGRGFRYQDAVTAWLATLTWNGEASWKVVVPEGLDDVTLHGADFELRVQIKSRHDPQGTFTQAEAAKYLAKSAENLPYGWDEDSRFKLALVLERPVEGLLPTGWSTSLSDSGQSLNELTHYLSVLIGENSTVSTEAFLARAHLIVEAEPIERGCSALRTSRLPPAAARLAFQQLREQAGSIADANYTASATAPVTLDQTDVQMRIDRVTSVIDPLGYVELTAGLAELADFGAAVPTEGFYRGVNVVPGHVGAGLVFNRPNLMTDVLAGLEAKRFTLVAGPSGAGKSGLAWLAAHRTRHAVRWYRVRELPPSGVARLLQLARLLEARPQRPVGFVIDDVGRQETAGWDALVREIEAEDSILAIGTVREEDIFLLATATRTPTVRPALDEELAFRIWSALQESGSVAFSHWREPFELSHGLLLEFTHLLSAGKRLEETIREQVRRRLVENRGDELILLRTVSFASAQAAAVDPILLRFQSRLDETRFAKALQRLVDEHAVRLRPDGALTGLHEIRSTYLDEAIQEFLMEPRRTALLAAVEALVPDAFAGFIVRVLQKWPTEENALIEGLALRLKPHETACWTSIFHGLGLATADRVADKWLEISRAAGIDDRLSSFMFMLALGNREFTGIKGFEVVSKARREFADVDVTDLRKSLIDRMADSVQKPELDLDGANELAAALLPIAGCKSRPTIRPLPKPDDLAEAPIKELITFLTTVRETGVEAARKLVELLGGTEALLERMFQEMDWVTRPALASKDGLCCVSSYVRFIHPEIQPDLNDEVVRLCEAMAAVVPEAELLVSDVLTADGSSFGLGGEALHSKHLSRSALPAPARVAWNRAQIRAIQRLVAAPVETGRTTSLANAIVELESRLREAGDYFCRMEAPGPKWKLSLKVRGLLTDFVQPPTADEVVSGPLDKGKLKNSDKPYDFVMGLQQLIADLTEDDVKRPDLLVVRTAGLINDADSLLLPELWRMTSEPPIEAITRTRAVLRNLRAVLGDVVADSTRRRRLAARFRSTSRHHAILHRAAEEACRRAENAVEIRRNTIRQAMGAIGLDVEVFSRRLPEDGGYEWPCVEFAVLLRVETLVDWMATGDSFASAATSLEGFHRIAYGAVLGDRIAPMGMSFLQSLHPYPDFADEWAASLPYPPIDDDGLRNFDRTLDAIVTMSTVVAHCGRELNASERGYFDLVAERASLGFQTFSAQLNDEPNEVLAQAASQLAQLFERVDAEFSGADSHTLAAELMEGTVGGSLNDLTLEVLAARISLIELAASEEASLDSDGV